MKITEYGTALCKATNDATALKAAVGNATGATASMRATTADAGIIVAVTGNGLRKTAKSVAGAYFMMLACHKLANAWHVLPCGKRRLVMRK